MPYTIAELNQMSQKTFVDAVGEVFENTPAIAEKTWALHPFSHVTDLHQKMVEVMHQMTPDEQLTLIQAHPDLGSRATMTDSSVHEQTGVGLNQLTPDEYERFQALNQAYKTKFGFPFIVAVKTHTKTSILETFERRLAQSRDTEIQQALTEIADISWFRLLSLIEEK